MEPPLAKYHEAIAPLDEIELRLLRSLDSGSLSLPSDHEAIIRHALNLARLRTLRVRSKADVYVARDLDPFRRELGDLLGSLFLGPLYKVRKVDGEALKAKVPYLRQETRRFRDMVLAAHGALLSPERLDRECCDKKLVLALGGGGGAALAHLGVLLGLEEQGLRPSLIAGTSMGAVIGLFRAMSEQFQPLQMGGLVPADFDLGKILGRYIGHTHFGLVGVFTLQGYEVAEEIFKRHNGRGIPPISELPIPLRVVVTGLKQGIRSKVESAEPRIVSAAPGKNAIWRRMVVSLATSAAELSEDPSLLDRIVFGADPGTADFDAVDAAGFSAAIPGVIHYDIFREGSRSEQTLNKMFKERGLFRLCDGGATENVPARAAWESMQSGTLETRNAFVLACDCFAPRAARGVVLYPIQHYVRANASQSLPYANLVLSYAKPPSSFRLLGNFERLERITRQAREEFQGVAGVVARAVAPLPSWSELDTGAV